MKQYPEWQTLIREAQLKATAKQIQKDAEFAEKVLAIRKENGQHLKHVLSYFGIEGELDIDVVTIGNYYFKLYTEGRNGEAVYYFYHNEKDNVDTIGFHLMVRRILPEYEPDGFEWDGTASCLNIGRRHITEEEKHDWFVVLATSIDEIDRRYDELYPRYLEYKANEANPPEPAPVVKKLTIEQQLTALISRIVEEELDRRNEEYY